MEGEHERRFAPIPESQSKPPPVKYLYTKPHPIAVTSLDQEEISKIFERMDARFAGEEQEKEGSPLPGWIEPDPRPKKGRLLYIEEWAQKGKYRNRTLLFPVQILGSLALVIFSLSLLSSSREGVCSGVFLAFLLALCTLLTLRDLAEEMPFSIYEGGFTLTKRAESIGFDRKENFVPWSMVWEVSAKGRNLIIYYGQETLLLGPPGFSDFFEVVRYLGRCLPEKMFQPSVRKLLEEDGSYPVDAYFRSFR